MVTFEETTICYICGSDKFVDDHHYDCNEGKFSPETIPLCRRCHRTYHNFGVDWFDDEYLDRAIQMENKCREIHRANSHKLGTNPRPPMTREDVKRSSYWNKIHGVARQKTSKKARLLVPAEQLPLPLGD